MRPVDRLEIGEELAGSLSRARIAAPGPEVIGIQLLHHSDQAAASARRGLSGSPDHCCAWSHVHPIRDGASAAMQRVGEVGALGFNNRRGVTPQQWRSRMNCTG